MSIYYSVATSASAGISTKTGPSKDLEIIFTWEAMKSVYLLWSVLQLKSKGTTLLSVLLIVGSQVKAAGHFYQSDMLSNHNIIYTRVLGLDVSILTNVIFRY